MASSSTSATTTRGSIRRCAADPTAPARHCRGRPPIDRLVHRRRDSRQASAPGGEPTGRTGPNATKRCRRQRGSPVPIAENTATSAARCSGSRVAGDDAQHRRWGRLAGHSGMFPCLRGSDSLRLLRRAQCPDHLGPGFVRHDHSVDVAPFRRLVRVAQRALVVVDEFEPGGVRVRRCASSLRCRMFTAPWLPSPRSRRSATPG